MEDVTVFKLVSIAAIWLVGFVGGLTPALLAGTSSDNASRHRSPRTTQLLSTLNAFSGGVFLAGGFFHLLHAAIENPALRKWSEVDDGKYEFPYAEMFCTLGFLALLLLEQGAHAHMAGGASSSSSTYTRAKTSDSDDVDSDFGLRSDDASATYLEDMDDDDDISTSDTKRLSPHSHNHSHAAGGHSHMAPRGSSLAVALVLFLALSFHSVLEGLGIGAQSTAAWGVFLAIVVHKGLAAFALGSGLVQSAMPRAHVVLYMVVFSFMSIIGILIGWWIDASAESEDSAAAGICVALAAGTFIYVAVMEVIPQEFPRHGGLGGGSGVKAAALCVGYAGFGLLAKWS